MIDDAIMVLLGGVEAAADRKSSKALKIIGVALAIAALIAIGVAIWSYA